MLGPGVDRAGSLSPLSPLTGTGTETGVLTESYLPIHQSIRKSPSRSKPFTVPS
jgi:hypothetical protein